MDDTAAAVNGGEIMYRPHGLANHVGREFFAGSAGGTVFYSILGYRRSGRLAAAARAGLRKAPHAGGLFAAYSALIYIGEGVMAAARGRHDRWNTVASSAAALGLVHAPLIGRAAVASVLAGAVLGGVFGSGATTICTVETPGPSIGSISVPTFKQAKIKVLEELDL